MFLAGDPAATGQDNQLKRSKVKQDDGHAHGKVHVQKARAVHPAGCADGRDMRACMHANAPVCSDSGCRKD